MRLQAKRWQEQNPEKTKESQRKYNRSLKGKLRSKRYRETHKKERAEAFKKWYLKNKKRMNDLHKKWIDKNKERAKQIDRKQYARRKKAIGSFTIKEWNDLKKKYNFKCAICGRRKKLTVDHIIPLSKGGTNYIDNIQPLCKSCNSSKNNKLLLRNE